MTEKEFKAYFASRKLMSRRTPEELKKELEKFEWTKEVFMEGKTKTIHEIEEKISGMIAHMINFTQALKELVPKVIEKKIKLISGQIYKHYNGTHYLLFEIERNEWTLINLETRFSHWCHRTPTGETEQQIRQFFTLCPKASITVKEWL